MQINVTFDASTQNAPAGFFTAVNAAVQYLDQAFDAPIVVNIDVGWGEVGGQPITGGAVGESSPSAIALNYDELRDALWADAITPTALLAAESLPATDPTNGGTFLVATAEAKLFGLINPQGSAIDGSIGLDSSTSFSFDPNNRAQLGLIDAIGVIEHEITEVLGRASSLGAAFGGTNLFGPLDLFRYASTGDLAPTSPTGFFSVDGQNLLLPFNNPANGGDSGDWSQTVTGDAFDAFVDLGTTEQISAADLTLMDALGYHPAVPVLTITAPNVALTAPFFQEVAGLTVAQGQTLYFNDADNQELTFGGGAQVSSGSALTNNGTIVTTSTGPVDLLFFSTALASFSDSTTVTNGPTGVLEAETTGGGLEADAFFSSTWAGTFNNQGLIKAVSVNGSAGGVHMFATPTPDYDFINAASGVVEAWGATGAFALGAGDIGTVQNAGLIYATAADGGATAIDGGAEITNTGTIEAVAQGPGSTSLGIALAEIDIFTPINITNSGVIEANEAIVVEGETGSITVTNQAGGKILGNIELGDEQNTITNAGIIAGDIFFGNVNSSFNSSGGHFYGAIFLGEATNTVTLGPDGNAVYGGGVADTMTGGAGNDFFEIFRGNNSINGGGGFNILSFADSDATITANIGTGTATSIGTDTFTNIQELIASDFNSTLIAGAAAATLVGGAGDDTLVGGAGNDTLVAGTGGGTMTGGGGNNTFIYSAGGQQLVVTDFDQGGDKDVLDIYGYSAPTSMQQQGADTLITLGGGDSVLLKGVDAASIAAGAVVYNAQDYNGPTTPPSEPTYGTKPIEFSSSFNVFANETLNEALPLTQQTTPEVALYDDGLSSVDIAGIVRVTGLDPTGLLYNFGSLGSATLTVEQGAIFSVSSTTGSAAGVRQEPVADPPPLPFTNAGTFEVSGAIGAQGALTTGSFVNTASGVFTVSQTSALAGGAAVGVIADNALTVTNNGQFTVTDAGSGLALGIQFDAPLLATLDNTGHLTVTAAAGDSATAIQLSTAQDRGSAMPVNIINSGYIQALTAISEPETFEDASLNVQNSGTLIGDVNLRGSENVLRNTGTLTGDIIISDQGDSGFAATNTIDLRGGAFNGAIELAPGRLGNIPTSDTIYAGGGTMLIGIAGGESQLALTVVGTAASQTTVKLDIASSAATETHNANGSWTVNAGTDGTLTLTDVQTLQFTDASLTLSNGAARDDFNADGKSDFLIQNTAGVVVVGEDQGGSAAYTAVSDLGNEWHFKGNGDFLGDGKEGFLIENAAGAVDVGEVSNGSTTYSQVAGLGSEWSFRGAGDFLGDGQDQFLIENSSGAVVVGEVKNGGAVYTNVSGLGSEWSFRGVGDFLGDGKDDFLIQNSAGAVVVGEVVNGAASYTNVVGLGPEWKFVGTGDFLGEGHDQFLIENTAGAVDIGDYAAGAIHFTNVTGLGSEWKFVGAGDYLGEGHDQFLIENASGAVVVGDYTSGQVHFTQVAGLGPEWAFH